MKRVRNPRKGIRNIAAAIALSLLAMFSALALSGAQANAATLGRGTVTAGSSSQSVVPLEGAQASNFNQVYGTLTAMAPQRPDGAGCPPDYPYSCGWILSKAQTQALWKLAVNSTINAAAAYCRGLFGGALTNYCNWAANLLRNLSAPNGRCFYVGVKPSVSGSSVVAGYTTYFCY